MKPKPLIDNVDDMRAHAVRRLVECAHCKGLGDKHQMILGSHGHDAALQYHTQCYRRRFGFDAVLRLSSIQRDKFRLCDLSPKEMRKLISQRPTSAGWDDQP